PLRHLRGPLAALHPLINQLGEEAGINNEVAPLGVERRGWLCSNNVGKRTSLLLERGNIIADGDEHVAVILELCSIADRPAMTGNDDRLFGRSGQICFCGANRAVDASASRV